MKKFISAVLVVILLAGMGRSAVFAADTEAAEKDTAVEEHLEKPPQELLDVEKPVMFLAMNEGDVRARSGTENVTLRVGERVNYGNWSTNYFYINDKLAYCLEPSKKTPSGGDYVAEVLCNDELTKGMYYLMGGPGFTEDIREAFFSSAAGFTDQQIYAFCHAVLSFIYRDYDINSDAFLGLNEEEKKGIMTIGYQIRDLLPAPPDGTIDISPNHQTAYWDETSGRQWTRAYKITGDVRNVLSFALPEGVRLHNLTTGVIQDGNVSVKGGESFRLEGDAWVDGKWESGKLKGSIQETYMSFLIHLPGEGQDIGGLTYHKEPLDMIEFSASWTGRGLIRIKKVCTQTDSVLSGAEFAVYAKDNIVRNGVTLAKAGELMANIVTDDKGMGSTSFLPVDACYIIRETKAPEGYMLSDEAVRGIEVNLAHESGNRSPEVTVEIDNTLISSNFMIHKVIKASEIVWANGNPTFLFQITGKDMKGKRHSYAKVMEFTEDYVESHTDQDGNVRMSVIFENIPCGKSYAVTEENVNRYVLTDVSSSDSNVKVRRLQDSTYGKEPKNLFEIMVDLYQKPYGSSVTFRNEKVRWDDWSHNEILVNHLGQK